jgi:hypothetical protein
MTEYTNPKESWMQSYSHQEQTQQQQKRRRRRDAPIDWPSYDKALVQRGSLTVWFSKDVVEGWHPEHGKKRGGQFNYSDIAIETGLTLRLVFSQPLRQTEGFLQSIIDLMNLDIKSPDHSTFSRRSKGLVLKPVKRRPGQAVTVVVDSSGLKIYGQGEWDASKHGRKNRREWCKIHLCIDEGSLEILSHSLTTDEVGDSTEVPALLDEITDAIDEFLGDGAYDGKPIYDCVEGHHGSGEGKVTVPPRSNAILSAASEPTQRDYHVRFIDKHGRKAWNFHQHYGRRLLVENAIYRYKTIIGRRMRARDHSAQKTEAALGCKILNRMSQLGLPQPRLAA